MNNSLTPRVKAVMDANPITVGEMMGSSLNRAGAVMELACRLERELDDARGMFNAQCGETDRHRTRMARVVDLEREVAELRAALRRATDTLRWIDRNAWQASKENIAGAAAEALEVVEPPLAQEHAPK